MIQKSMLKRKSLLMIQIFKDNWKLGIHLLFRTKRFGVNNRWWNEFDSMFGLSFGRKILRIICIKPLLNEWIKIKERMSLGFIDKEAYKTLFN